MYLQYNDNSGSGLLLSNSSSGKAKQTSYSRSAKQSFAFSARRDRRAAAMRTASIQQSLWGQRKVGGIQYSLFTDGFNLQ